MLTAEVADLHAGIGFLEYRDNLGLGESTFFMMVEVDPATLLLYF